MKTKKILLAFTIASSFIVSACATTTDYNRPYSYDSRYGYDYSPSNAQHNHYGVVENVRWIEQDTSGIGAGAIIGGVVGGLVGNQIGSGSGRTAATIGGAIAGGAIGDHVQDRNTKYKQIVDVRLEGGNILSIVQDDDKRFYKGQRVRVVGSGDNVRIITSDSYEYR